MADVISVPQRGLELLQAHTRVRVRRDGTDVEEDAVPWAGSFVSYALLAAIVYRDRSAGLSPPDGWQRVEVRDDPKTSLYYEVWDHAAAIPAEVAIVFKGTHEARDWWSNLRWVTRFIPVGWDQYTVVRKEISRVVDRAQRRMPGADMVSVGHSLGGGLAQQAAYAHPDIKKVIAFDPSPVTGFRSVPTEEREVSVKGMSIFRVYEKGEILAFLRGFVKKVVPLSTRDPEVVEVRFNLSKGFAVKEHSMVDLAKRMRDLLQPT